MELLKTLNNQNNLEKMSKAEHITFDFKLYCLAIAIKMAWYWHKNGTTI